MIKYRKKQNKELSNTERNKIKNDQIQKETN